MPRIRHYDVICAAKSSAIVPSFGPNHAIARPTNYLVGGLPLASEEFSYTSL